MKLWKSLSLAAIIAATMTGCGGAAPEEEADFRCRIDGTLAPEWACGNANSMEGSIVAVGSAPLSQAGQGFSRREAMANGRSNLAQQISTLVKDKVENFTRSTGIGAGESVDKVSTQVGKQVAKVALKGSKQLKYWQHPVNKDIYVLMGAPEAQINDTAKKTVKTSFKNDEALWQQFQAKQGLEGLEKEFAND